ncbi:MAG: hypothetical protein UW19_C0021G0017 [Candidatus Moranbacteria bacterium GW2011_GWF2_44_10]|nr:MAG: hypothetical protein UW19_C0021G0017 [Candidatus Moranbacteria bacterium GW2011_GWF2_44_10]
MENKLKTQRFTVRLTDNDINRLHEIASREGFYASAVVRHLIVRFLESRQALGGVNGHVTI